MFVNVIIQDEVILNYEGPWSNDWCPLRREDRDMEMDTQGDYIFEVGSQ